MINKVLSRLFHKSRKSLTSLFFDPHNPFDVQKKLLPNPANQLSIIDVGAYRGDIARQYQKTFPNSIIYCFEPFPESFAKLKKNTASFPNIHTFNKGMGDKNGTVAFQSNQSPLTNSLLPTHKESDKNWGEGLLNTKETVEVELITLDNFVENQGLKKIDILKMDVQGAEYLVLQGAQNSFQKGIIEMIYTEIITLPTYEKQKQLDEIIAMLRFFDFELFNFYNPSTTHSGQLRQVDAIFVRKKSK